jgi:hypothetical protein
MILYRRSVDRLLIAEILLVLLSRMMLQIGRYRLQSRSNYLALCVAVLVFAGAGPAVRAQSTEQEYPAPVTQSELSGTIRARDIGDARLTSHYWAFDGEQGDIFINVVTQNLSADIDVYLGDGLRPLTKMVVFADAGTTETGRVIYMRQPGRLLLRVQGRSPNDDPARYTIKFAGSFVALAPERLPKPPTVGDLSDTGVAVSSSGAILPQKPKPIATPKATPGRSTAATVTQSADKGKATTTAPLRTKDGTGVDTVFGNKTANVTVPKPTTSPAKTAEEKRASLPAKKEAEPDPMANVRLVVNFRDGHTVERPMSEVARFIYANGYLTVALKDGKTYRYAMSDLASVNVQ